ncbi:MAG: hypothetical protein ACE5JS_23115 [Nitrospinota bacterium]
MDRQLNSLEKVNKKSIPAFGYKMKVNFPFHDPINDEVSFSPDIPFDSDPLSDNGALRFNPSEALGVSVGFLCGHQSPSPFIEIL